MFDAYRWYWLADDGRLYSAKTQSLVQSTDADYVAFQQWHTPTTWPRDDADNQNDASLQAVLVPYHTLFANLEYYTADVRWRKIETGIVVNGHAFACDPYSLSALNSATIYTGSASGQGAVINWKLADGTFTELNKTEVNQLQLAAQGFCQSCFNCEAAVLGDIGAGTVTTRTQIDAAFAAISNVFTSATELADGAMMSETVFRRWRPRK
jgi:hypothetical protein